MTSGTATPRSEHPNRSIALFLSVIAAICMFGACLSPADTYSVDAKAVVGLMNFVGSRTGALVEEWDEPSVTLAFNDAVTDVMAHADGDRIPSSVAPSIAFICDLHDALIRTDPTLSPLELESYLRSSQLLRDVFRVSAEPILLPGFGVNARPLIPAIQ